MGFGLNIVAQPATEPITLAQAKAHLRLETSADDDLVTAKIVAARSRCERVTGRALITQTLRLTVDAFPGQWGPSCSGEWNELGVLRLPRPPLQSVGSITYIDTAGTSQTLASTEYQVEADVEPGRVRPAYGKIWPVTRADLGAVKVVYVAGYGAASAVPAEIRDKLLAAVNYLYVNRDGTAEEEVLDKIFAGNWYGGLG